MAFENAMNEAAIGKETFERVDQSKFLRRVLQGNALFSALSGGLFLVNSA